MKTVFEFKVLVFLIAICAMDLALADDSTPTNTISTINTTGTSTLITTPTVTSPPLTTTLTDTCMGSVSFGLSLTGFGAVGGTTMVDEACVRRLDAREFRSMGLNDVALALLCQSAANKKAVEAAGHQCPQLAAPIASIPSVPLVQNENQPIITPQTQPVSSMPTANANKQNTSNSSSSLTIENNQSSIPLPILGAPDVRP